MNRSNIIHKVIVLSIALFFAIAQAVFQRTERVPGSGDLQAQTKGEELRICTEPIEPGLADASREYK